MSNANPKVTREKDLKDSMAAAGVQQRLQDVPVHYLGGKQFTPSSLEAFLRSRLEKREAVKAAKAGWKRAIAEYNARDREVDVVLRDLRNTLVGMHGEDPAILKQFGFKAHKRNRSLP